VADLVVTVSLTPNRPGANALAVQASSSRRPPPAAVDGVAVEVAGGAGRVPLALTAPGTYVGTVRLAAAGAVRITAVVSRAGKRIAVPVGWTVDPPLTVPSEPASGQPAADSDPGLRSMVNLLAVPLLGALVLVGWRWTRRRRRAGAPDPDPEASPEPMQTAEPVLGGVQ
jgi:copper transport protein